MELLSPGWRCVLLYLCVSFHRCPLLLTGCLCWDCGNLTVQPGELFLLGSNLTFYCHNTECKWGTKTILEVNGKYQYPGKKINATTVMFTLVNVQMPSFYVLCILDYVSSTTTVSGLDLNAGLPPDKPQNVRCETWKNLPFLECSWERGRETHISTMYNISIGRENGTWMLFAHVKNETIEVPCSALDKDGKYQVNVTAYNHFGFSQSDPVSFELKDRVIPEAPHIKQITFENTSVVAILQWNTTESSQCLRPSIRLRTGNSNWEAGDARVHKGLVYVYGLTHLTDYVFQMRTCHSGGTPDPGCTNSSATTQKSLCSRWSLSMGARSPGKGPSQQLHVWRIFRNLGADKLWNVTVLWKPPSPDDYSGEVQYYKIFNEHMKEMKCAAALSQCTLQVPAGLQTLRISVVTQYGASPPADVPLRYSGESQILLREVLPADNGSSLLVSWSLLLRESGGKVLHYVLEWVGVAASEPQWKWLASDQNSTSITGLNAGVRYNISLYAVASAGVSKPSSRLVYSREQKPASGPSVLVLQHEPGRIHIQWDRLPVDQQRGFITGYNIYLRTLDPSGTEHRATVNGSEPGRKWLDCPEGSLVLQATASTSAGEGLRGKQIYSPAAGPAHNPPLLVVTGFIVVILVAIFINLMCLCCEKRIKKKCLSWKPACLDEPLPKPGNSVAIRLLKLEGNEPIFSSPNPDPPLSPISLVCQEEPYPSIHPERSRAGLGHLPAEKPLLMVADYKPQIPLLAAQKKAEVDSKEEQREKAFSLEEGGCREEAGGLLGGLFPTADVDSPSLTLCSVGSCFWLVDPQRSLFQAGFSLGQSTSAGNEDARPPSLELLQCEISDYMAADPCLPQNKAATAMPNGYFPQTAPACNTHSTTGPT